MSGAVSRARRNDPASCAHLCFFYESQDDLRAWLLPFVSEGLARGETVVCAVDADVHDELVRVVGGPIPGVADPSPGAESAHSRGRLEVVSNGDVYLRNGVFDPDRVLDSLAGLLRRAALDGSSALRLVGQVVALPDAASGLQRLTEYESRVEALLSGLDRSRCIVACAHSLSHVEPATLLDVLACHSGVASRAGTHPNPFFAEPAALRRRGDRAELERRLRIVETQRPTDDEAARSDARWRSLLASVPTIVFEIDREGTILFINQVVPGLSVEEVVGRSHLDFIPEESRDRVDDVVRRVFETGEPATYETTGVGPDGTMAWYETRAGPLLSAGEVGSVVLSTMDITARKHALEAARRQAERLAAQYAIATEVAALRDRGVLLRGVLDVIVPLLGCDAAWVAVPSSGLDDEWTDAARIGVPDSLPPPGALAGERLRAWIETAGFGRHAAVPLAAGGRVLGTLSLCWRSPSPPGEGEELLLAAVGRQLGVALENARLYEAASALDRLRIIHRLDVALASTLDLSEVAKVALRESAAAFGASAGVLLLFPRDGGTGGVRTFDLEHAEVEPAEGFERGRSVHPLLREPPDSREDLSLSGRDVARLVPGDPHGNAARWGNHGLLVLVRHDAERLGALALGGRATDEPLTDEDRAFARAIASRVGQAIRNVGLFEDMKALLREKERSQAQLVQATKMGALGRLVSSIAHEIANPLQAVSVYLDLAREEASKQDGVERIRDNLDVVAGEFGRISALLAHLRDFYRPARSGQVPTDVDEVLGSVLAFCRKKLEQSRISVERRRAANVPQIPANPDHLRQVFLNLVLNAIDAMPDGGVLRTSVALDGVDGTARSSASPSVRIEISDTGIGMSEEVRSKVFEPFFTTKDGGAGLGLSVSYGIAEAHGGRISVASSMAKGATFTVLLPAGERATPIDEPD